MALKSRIKKLETVISYNYDLKAIEPSPSLWEAMEKGCIGPEVQQEFEDYTDRVKVALKRSEISLEQVLTALPHRYQQAVVGELARRLQPMQRSGSEHMGEGARTTI